jgi:hypothetical protein
MRVAEKLDWKGLILIVMYECDNTREQNKEVMDAMNLLIFLYASICRPLEVNKHCIYYQ